MSTNKQINIAIFGIGNVGSTLIDQIFALREKLGEEQGLTIQIPVIANSKQVLLTKGDLHENWQSGFNKFAIRYEIADIIHFISEYQLENLIAIDVTASKDFVENYIPLIINGFHIISANKIANTLPIESYKELRETLNMHGKKYLYETNVGAGLPIIETIKNLHDSGERIEKIRGVFSGSLSYIFNLFSESNVSFSEVLSEASALGLTEPDAREDLCGNDVARKLLILARELDLQTNIEDIEVESLVPTHLNGSANVAHFKERVAELDLPFQKRRTALKENEVLRYVGELDVVEEKLSVRLISEEKTTALGQLKGADSVFEIYSKSYRDFPLVIQGAGAGKEVTARGVLSDLIKLSNKIN